MHSVGSKCLQAPQLDCDGRRSENETKKEEANGREKKERQREGKTGRRRGGSRRKEQKGGAIFHNKFLATTLHFSAKMLCSIKFSPL